MTVPEWSLFGAGCPQVLDYSGSGLHLRMHNLRGAGVGQR
jgi:hypothetical protein